MAFPLWASGSGNGAVRKAQPPPRRGDDDPGSDYRYHRVYHHHGNGNGGGDGRGQVVTSAMVSLAVAALVAGVGWLGFTRGEIDRTLAPLREDILSLQSAHGRLDDRMSREIQRLDETKVSDKTRLAMLDDINRRLAAIERATEAATEHGHLLLQQNTVQDTRVEELRQRLLAVERRLRISDGWESPGPDIGPRPPFGSR
jgi:hypothetical protein